MLEFWGVFIMWYAFGAGVHARHRVGEDVDIQETALYLEHCREFMERYDGIAFPGPIPATSDHDFWAKVKSLIRKGQSPDVVYSHYSWFQDAIDSSG